MSKVAIVAWFVALLTFFGSAAGQPPRDGALDEKKLALEDRKLALDRERLDFDKYKYERDQELEKRKVYVTGLSVAVPLLAAVLAYMVQVWVRKRDETLQFQLKAAEIVMDSRDTNEAMRKGEMLTKLFPKRLDTLKQALQKDTFPYFGPSNERREELLRILAQYPESRKDILAAWEMLFPWDSSATNWEQKSAVERSKYKWFDKLKGDASLNQNKAKLDQVPLDRDFDG